MSQTPITQTTKDSTSQDSPKRGRPRKETTDEVKATLEEAKAEHNESVIDLAKLEQQNMPSAEARLKVAAQLTELESAVVYARQAKIEWMEVEEDILKYFNRGKLPSVGYYIYKGVKLCLKDTAPDLARREGLSCHEILFPKEGYMKVGVKRV